MHRKQQLHILDLPAIEAGCWYPDRQNMRGPASFPSPKSRGLKVNAARRCAMQKSSQDPSRRSAEDYGCSSQRASERCEQGMAACWRPRVRRSEFCSRAGQTKFLISNWTFLKRLKGAQLDGNVIARVVRLTAGESALFRSGILQVARHDVR